MQVEKEPSNGEWVVLGAALDCTSGDVWEGGWFSSRELSPRLNASLTICVVLAEMASLTKAFATDATLRVPTCVHISAHVCFVAGEPCGGWHW